MFCTKLILVLSAVLAVNHIQCSFANLIRTSGGQPVEILRRFPHHVLIREYNNTCNGQWSQTYQEVQRVCSGSIVNDRWVLTAASCVQSFDVLELSFERLYLSKTNGSYSIIVNSDAVHLYPTQHDDIALVKLPSILEISSTVKPIDVYSGPNLIAGKFVVLSGYEKSNSSYDVTVSNTISKPLSLNCENKMVYGMFSISSAAACKADAGKDFDEFLQYCTKPWDRTRNTPTTMDIGNGLVVNWPKKPQLVGIYIGSSDWNNVAVYTNVAKYASWIEGVIYDIPIDYN